MNTTIKEKYGVSPELREGKRIVFLNKKTKKQDFIDIPKFAKGQEFTILDDKAILKAVANGVPIQGHFIEAENLQGDLAKKTRDTAAKSRKFQRITRFSLKIVGTPRVQKSTATTSFAKLQQGLDMETAVKILSAANGKNASQLSKGDLYKLAIAPLGLPADATAKEVYDEIRKDSK